MTLIISEAPLFVKEEVMTQSSAAQSHGKAAPKGLEDTITAVTASITGDRGNIHYAEELKKAGKGMVTFENVLVYAFKCHVWSTESIIFIVQLVYC